jgi:adenylosuccinate synthase
MFIDLCKRALEDHRMKGKFKPEKIYDEQMRQLERILTYGMVEDTSVLVNKWLDEGKCGLLEGAQGTHLDILHGTYPFVTSSNTVAGNACTGACVGPTRISRVVGVVKAYVTRVGAGPFPTEMPEDVAKRIRNRNDERGATTGRDRRIGYPDVPLVLSSVELNSVTELAITRLDGLDGEGSIPVCTHYGCKNPERFPGPGEIRDAAPKYEELKLWTGSVNGVTNYDKLGDAQHYIEFWEQKTGRPVTIISTGPNREHTIRRDSKDSNVKDAYRAAHSG